MMSIPQVALTIVSGVWLVSMIFLIIAPEKKRLGVYLILINVLHTLSALFLL